MLKGFGLGVLLVLLTACGGSSTQGDRISPAPVGGTDLPPDDSVPPDSGTDPEPPMDDTPPPDPEPPADDTTPPDPGPDPEPPPDDTTPPDPGPDPEPPPVPTGSVTVTADLNFAVAGDKQLLIESTFSELISVTGVVTSVGITGLSTAPVPVTCQDLSAGDSCVVSVTAEPEAYGSGSVTVLVSGYSQTEFVVPVSIGGTTIAINPDISGDGQDITGIADGNTHSFTVRNTGGFAWRNASVTHSAEDAWLTLSEPVSGACTGSIARGDSCSVEYVITAPYGHVSAISATVDNALLSSRDLIPDRFVEVAPETDASFVHLSYRAVKITNRTLESVVFTDFVTAPVGLVDKVEVCPSTPAGCDFISSCSSGDPLPAGGVCHVWYRAVAGDNALGSTTSAVTVSVSAHSPTGAVQQAEATFDFTYTLSLLVGGYNLAANARLYQYDGFDWIPLFGDGNAGTIQSMVVFKGDLIVGGQLSAIDFVAVSNIARWNGESWLTLGNGTNDSVYDLASDRNQLYAGGFFTDPGSRVAGWDGVNWSGLGGGLNNTVLALTLADDMLYLGGFFTEADGLSTPYVATWDVLNETFAPVASGSVSDPVVSLGYDTTLDQLYIGSFAADINHIGRWDGASLFQLGDGLNSLPYAITLNHEGHIVVGGIFTSAGSTVANYVAAYDGAVLNDWMLLGQGLNAPVQALASRGTALYAGGGFSVAGAVGVNHIAVWQDNAWSALDNDGQHDIFDVRSLLVAPQLEISVP